MSKKRALITGITGQDGAYLAEFLIQKGYQVHGLRRRSSLPNTVRLEPLLQKYTADELVLHHGDLTDSGSLFQVIKGCEPDEIYNLAAQSDVGVSFESPEYAANVNGLGALRLLEAIRILGFEKKSRFYQASTSELYGLVQEMPQKETTPFYPRSPYAVSKLYAYWMTINYRESYGLFACNGILFNHESPMRGESFVTRKITRSLTRILMGLEKSLYLGNLDAKRDWGYTRDFVEMQWLILQQEKPEDFVIATGEQHSVREFVNLTAARLGMNLKWEGKGLGERAVDEQGRTIVAVDPRFFRPAEVETLLGDPTKAFEKLGWKPKSSFEELVNKMVDSDLALAREEAASNDFSLR